MTQITQKGVNDRESQFNQRLGSLAYQKEMLLRQIKDIDHDIAAIEGALQANEASKKDILADIAVAQVKEKEAVEAAEKTAKKK